MPWDCHSVPEKLTDYFSRTPLGRALIPGCGSAYEVDAFHTAGWSVTAMDFSPVAVERAKGLLGPLHKLDVCGDFFRHPLNESSFDLVYERTFLCALPPKLWPDYTARMRQLIRPGGKLVGFFLYGEESEPPPYPLTKAQVGELFMRDFILTEDEPIGDSLSVFAGKECWQEWTRTVTP